MAALYFCLHRLYYVKGATMSDTDIKKLENKLREELGESNLPEGLNRGEGKFDKKKFRKLAEEVNEFESDGGKNTATANDI